MPRRLIPGLLVVASIAVLLAIIVPYMLHLRDEARKTQSRDNLHNLGLALHNYHDPYGAFPPGGIIRADGVAMHGWCTSILPYIDSNPLSAALNFHYPWDDAENTHLFCLDLPLFRIPGVESQATNEGFDLIHYLANPNVLHRNSHIGVPDLTAGARQTWLLGEVAGEYHPRGYPFNWRPLRTRLISGSGSFGRPTGDGAFLLMGDASVSFLANDVAVDVLNALANAPPVASRDQMRIPDREFQYRDQPFDIERLELDQQQSRLRAEVWIDDAGRAQFSWIIGDKFDWRPPTVEDMHRLAQAFPEIRRLIGGPPVDDDVAGALSSFPNLELVKAPWVTVSDRGIASLARLPRLRLICVEAVDESLLDRLTAALPNCTIRISAR